MIEKIKKIARRQKEFQKMVGVPVDTVNEHERNKIAEGYLFKMIEEVIELRKEFPSVLNELSKKQKTADQIRILEELSDVILFIVNFILVWKIGGEEIVDAIEKVQTNNFQHVKNRKMSELNTHILSVPGYKCGIGSGNLSPMYVFVGMNPGRDIEHGYKFWSNENDGSSKVLLPILDKLGIRHQCYFTNLVKCTTPDNSEPTMDQTEFWSEFLRKEIEILRYDNPDMKVIAMGNWVDRELEIEHFKLTHPSYILREGVSAENYENEIQELTKIWG